MHAGTLQKKEKIAYKSTYFSNLYVTRDFPTISISPAPYNSPGSSPRVYAVTFLHLYPTLFFFWGIQNAFSSSVPHPFLFPGYTQRLFLFCTPTDSFPGVYAVTFPLLYPRQVLSRGIRSGFSSSVPRRFLFPGYSQ